MSWQVALALVFGPYVVLMAVIIYFVRRIGNVKVVGAKRKPRGQLPVSQTTIRPLPPVKLPAPSHSLVASASGRAEPKMPPS